MFFFTLVNGCNMSYLFKRLDLGNPNPEQHTEMLLNIIYSIQSMLLSTMLFHEDSTFFFFFLHEHSVFLNLVLPVNL